MLHCVNDDSDNGEDDKEDYKDDCDDDIAFCHLFWKGGEEGRGE